MNRIWLKQLEKVRPFRVYKLRGVSFYIYKAKNLNNSRWNNSILKQITKEARKSFLRYGRMPLINEYDNNAEVYLCRAVDKSSEEWLSVRFVPGNKGEILMEDLLQFKYNNIPISDFFAKNFYDRLVSVSRICSIYPYPRGLSKINTANFPARMKYTAKSFGLINKVFFSQHDFVYLTATVRKELLNKILGFSNRLQLRLPDAHRVIGCAPKEVRLRRGILAYRFPGYFLNIFELAGLLERLERQDKLRFDSVKKFIKFYRSNFKKYLKNKKYIEVLKKIKGLDRLLLVSGAIPGANISGEELRELVDMHVSDGPVLKIVAVDKWKKQLDKIKI